MKYFYDGSSVTGGIKLQTDIVLLSCYETFPKALILLLILLIVDIIRKWPEVSETRIRLYVCAVGFVESV